MLSLLKENQVYNFQICDLLHLRLRLAQTISSSIGVRQLKDAAARLW